MKKLLYLFLTVLIVGCSSDDSADSNSTTNCDLTSANTKFGQITGDMNYTQVVNLVGTAGDNFRTDNLGSGNELKFYRWDFCDGDEWFECWLINDERLNLKVKYFPDNSCSNNVNQTNYSSISVGDSYTQISSLLGNQGDNFRVDYNVDSSFIAKYYRWYNCLENSEYIEVWFTTDDSAFLITKSF
ncbi:hypothetical protein OAD14_06315 [Flavobacteriaceae bacterium]|nr:hypothetical protein [Flavobacteriaceae bacterium]